MCKYSLPYGKADIRGQEWHVLEYTGVTVLSTIVP